MRREHSFEFSWAVGNRIYQLRTARGMSQRDLALTLGNHSNEFVARWERGASSPSAETLVKLSDFFGVSVDWILKGERMDDTISRRDAIRWVKTECNPYGKPTLDYESGKKVMEHLEQMPSAQPDAIPLEWIAKHLEWLDNCDNDFAQLAKVGIRAMVEIWKKEKTQ
jgi:DNA-binding XRE family transcriptional regulator